MNPVNPPNVRKSVALFLMATSLLTASALQAETFLSNLPTNIPGYDGTVSLSTQRAVTFTTSGSAFSISSVTLNLLDYISSTDTAVLTIRLSAGSSPSTSVYGSFTAPTSASNASENFVFTPTSAITLQANTMYWMVIAATSNTNTFQWARSEEAVIPTGIGTFGTQQISNDGGGTGTWSQGSNGPHTFAISGTTTAVPEPSVMILLVLGFGALCVVGMRKRSGSLR